MKKALAPAAKPKHKGKPQGVVDIVPRPVSFCKGKRHRVKHPPYNKTRQSWKCLHPPVSVVNSQGPKGGGAPLSQRIARFLYTTPLAGPRGVSLSLHRVGGYRGNEIFFMCEILCALGSPYNANESFFSIGIFRRFGRGKGPFLAGRVRSLSCGVRGLSRASTGLCARVCVSFPECPGTPRVKRFQTDRLFSMGGSRYRPGKGKRLPTFFTPKSEVFCGVAEPLSLFLRKGPAADNPPGTIVRLMRPGPLALHQPFLHASLLVIPGKPPRPVIGCRL